MQGAKPGEYIQGRPAVIVCLGSYSDGGSPYTHDLYEAPDWMPKAQVHAIVKRLEAEYGEQHSSDGAAAQLKGLDFVKCKMLRCTVGGAI